MPGKTLSVFVTIGFCVISLVIGNVSAANAACVFGVARNDVLWIRSAPRASAGEVGSIPHDGCGVHIGECAGGTWCRVYYRGISGWANTRYLANDDKKSATGKNGDCPNGWYWDNNGDECVHHLFGTDKGCPRGRHWNRKGDKCVEDTD